MNSLALKYFPSTQVLRSVGSSGSAASTSSENDVAVMHPLSQASEPPKEDKATQPESQPQPQQKQDSKPKHKVPQRKPPSAPGTKSTQPSPP